MSLDKNIFPGKIEIPQIVQEADISEILREKYFKEQSQNYKRKEQPIPQIIINHIISVKEFKEHLTRNGGKYTSLMETIRKYCGLKTIDE